MSDCQDNKTIFPDALWKALMNLPALRYMKAPVDTVAQLYEKYPIGNEKGTFAFVHNENTFYTYHPRGWHRGEWKSINADSISSFFEIDVEFLQDGDILVYDPQKQKFIIKSGNVWNKIKEKFIQINRFFNQVDNIPSDTDDAGIYFVNNDSLTALYLVLGNKSIKIFNSSEYYFQTQIDTLLNIIRVDINNKVDRNELSNISIGIKDYKSDVNNISDLPTIGNTPGDARVVLNDLDTNQRSYIWLWNGSSWSRTAFTTFPSDVANKKDLRFSVGVGIIYTNPNALSIDYANRKLSYTGGYMFIIGSGNTYYPLTTALNTTAYETDFILPTGAYGEDNAWFLLLNRGENKLYVCFYSMLTSTAIGKLSDGTPLWINLGNYNYSQGQFNSTIKTTLKYNGVKYINGVPEYKFKTQRLSYGYCFFNTDKCPFNIDYANRKITIDGTPLFWLFTHEVSAYSGYTLDNAETDFVIDESISPALGHLWYLVFDKTEKRFYFVHYSLFASFISQDRIVLGQGCLNDPAKTFVCNGVFKFNGITYNLHSSDSKLLQSSVNLFAGSDMGCVDYQEIGDTLYSQVIIYGQSLSLGFEAPEAISTTPITDNYMVGSAPHITIGNDGSKTLQPLKATVWNSGTGGEQPIVSITNAFSKMYRRFVDKNQLFIASGAGTGSMSIEKLSKESTNGENYYNTMFLKILNDTKTAIGSSDVSVSMIVYMQGEHNYVGTTGAGLTSGTNATTDKDTYKALLLKLKNNMQADIMTAYRQTKKPLFFIYQTSGRYIERLDMSISQAQFEFAQENEDVILLNSCYPAPDYSGGHLSTNGYRMYGELVAKSLYKTIVKGERYNPVTPQKFTVQNNTLVIDFYVPVFPLVFDTWTTPTQTNYGFRIVQDGADVAITNININNNQVIIECQQSLTGNVEIIYAGLGRNGSGNLRDSDTYRSMTTYFDDRVTSPTKRESYTVKDKNGNFIYNKPYPMYNWCSNFYRKL